METPNHDDPSTRARMKAPCFPCVKRAGIVWAYVGPSELQPPFSR